MGHSPDCVYVVQLARGMIRVGPMFTLLYNFTLLIRVDTRLDESHQAKCPPSSYAAVFVVIRTRWDPRWCRVAMMNFVLVLLPTAASFQQRAVPVHVHTRAVHPRARNLLAADDFFKSFLANFMPQEADRQGDAVPAPPPPTDPIEKAFSFFFGKPEEGDVAGFARTASAPDTYPATKTEFAAPVTGDTGEVALLRPLLRNTNLEYLKLRLAYDASRDGWSAEAFHRGVDQLGPCIVVCVTQGGALCGGYAAKGFAGYGEARGGLGHFLFSWPTGSKSGAPAVKLQKVGGAGLATIDEPETGPRFGADGLTIRLDPKRERIAQSKLGAYYEIMPDKGRSLFAASDDPKATRLTRLRVYVGIWPKGERIPYDGAIPFAIE